MMINTRLLMRLVCVVLTACCLALLAQPAATAAQRLNIIVFLVDD